MIGRAGREEREGESRTYLHNWHQGNETPDDHIAHAHYDSKMLLATEFEHSIQSYSNQ